MKADELAALRRDTEALEEGPEKKEMLEALAELERMFGHTRDLEARVQPRPWWHSLASLFWRRAGVPVISGEVDPLAEAEVYASYGRYDTAIEVLEKAYRANPERVELSRRAYELRSKASQGRAVP